MDTGTSQVLNNIKLDRRELETKLLNIVKVFEVSTGLSVAHIHIIKGVGAQTLEVQTEVMLP